MFKMKKLAAIAAAAFMAVSSMAVNASAVTKVQETPYEATAYGTAKGALSVNDAAYRLVAAHTTLLNGVAPEIAVVFTVHDGSTGVQLYYDDPINYNSNNVSAMATSGSFNTVTLRGVHIVGVGTNQWVRSQTMRT